MTFLEECIAFCGPVWQRWIHHPWIEALLAGELSTERFDYWQVQNLSYLGNTVSELAYPKAPADGEWLRVRKAYSRQTADTRVELQLMDTYGEFAKSRWAARPARDGLVNFWVRTAYEGSFGDICCAFYVCYSFSDSFGKRYLQEKPQNLSAAQVAWVEQWVDPLAEELRAVTEDGINTYGANATQYEREKMKWHFLRGTQYQIGTFDAAWNLSDPWFGEEREEGILAVPPK
jgi:thiaminase/transcriptional activator TenA